MKDFIKTAVNEAFYGCTPLMVLKRIVTFILVCCVLVVFCCADSVGGVGVALTIGISLVIAGAFNLASAFPSDDESTSETSTGDDIIKVFCVDDEELGRRIVCAFDFGATPMTIRNAIKNKFLEDGLFNPGDEYAPFTTLEEMENAVEIVFTGGKYDSETCNYFIDDILLLN